MSSWPENARELRGRRPKFWVTDSAGRQWLRKEPRLSRPFEPAVEATVLRVARSLGLPAPESWPCSWMDSTGALHKGIAVRRFRRGVHPERSELSMGGDVIAGVDPTYDPNRRGAHTLPRIRTALQRWEQERHGAGLLQQFSDIVLFDAWVGNSDRHQENWGILHSPTASRLAPIFDTAACLGVELLDSHVLLADPATVRLEEYVQQCSSGFGDGSQKGLLTQERVVEEMTRWPEWENSKRWLLKFERLLSRRIAPFLRSVPDELWPAHRRALAAQILRRRLEWLKSRA